MLIDWFTVIAQAINFVILVWLLKRYLYQPILRAIDERDQRIAAQLREAEAKKADAEKERHEFQRRNTELENKRQALLQNAREEAGAERQRLTEAARREAEQLRQKLQEALRNEQQDLSREFTRRTQQEVFAIARKTLADLAGVGLEEQMTEMFIHRLNGLEGEARDRFLEAFGAAGHPFVVHSAFELPPDRQEAIRQVLAGYFGKKADPTFEVRPEQVSGIELSANGYKVAWSIADYLGDLEKSITELLPEAPAGTPSQAPIRPT